MRLVSDMIRSETVDIVLYMYVGAGVSMLCKFLFHYLF
jgi:hypothetical protein